MTMKIALSVWSCHSYFIDGTWNHVDFIEFVAKETKAKGVELLTRFWKPEELSAVQGALVKHGLEVACVGASNNFAQTDPEKRREHVAEIQKAVDLAQTFGARVVRVFAGDKPPEGITFNETKSWIIEGLKTASEYAAGKGITLCLENHGVFAGQAGQVQNILREVNSLYLRSTFDTGNFLLVNEDPSEALMVLGSEVAHVHFKDFIQVEEEYVGRAYQALSGDHFAGKIAGEGSIDLQGLIGSLHDRGYVGWLTVEFEGDDEQRLGSKSSIANLDRILQNY